ncbi:MAG: rhodanese-like domain-containing protein [Bacteroidota bacterium]
MCKQRGVGATLDNVHLCPKRLVNEGKKMKKVQTIIHFLKKNLLGQLSAILVLIPGCTVSQGTPDEFHQMLEGMYQKSVPLIQADSISKKYLLLDTRKKEEYVVSHLPGAKWVGYRDFEIDQLKGLEKDQPIVVYCSVGYRSERIGEQLKQAGFTKVYNLYGGIFEWKNTQRQVVNQTGTPTDTVHTYNRKWSKWLFDGEKVW